MAKMTIDAEKVERLRADERGRVYLGPEYKGDLVEVAVIGRVKEGEGEDE